LIDRLPITTYGMDILRKEAEPVKKITPSLIGLIEDMFHTMRNASGIGLAAPQVNKNISLLVVDISDVEDYKNTIPIAMINPVILDSHGLIAMEEGCLSIPNIRSEVERPEKIYVKYFDAGMNEITQEFNRLQARVIQHEIDHLHGKLFVDYLDKDQIKSIKRKLSDIKKGKITTDYPLFIYTD
jgi:peptide deformylase